MRITDNIYVLSGVVYSAINDDAALGEVYGIRTAEGSVLVDCGPPETGFSNIKDILAQYGLEHEKITHVILTHGHWDHCGSAKALQELGAKLIVGAADAFMCKNGGNSGLDTPFDQLPHIYPAFVPDIEIATDSALSINGLNFRFITIPGHTAGSLAALVTVDGKRVLFTGDSLHPNGMFKIEAVSFGWQGDINFSRESIVKSMHKLLKTAGGQTDYILPGHGFVCLKNSDRVLRQAAQSAFDTLR
jgi:glyoxylase-like metal-dependent hydrolase (beta-lactamase superfamily II)